MYAHITVYWIDYFYDYRLSSLIKTTPFLYSSRFDSYQWVHLHMSSTFANNLNIPKIITDMPFSVFWDKKKHDFVVCILLKSSNWFSIALVDLKVMWRWHPINTSQTRTESESDRDCRGALHNFHVCKSDENIIVLCEKKKIYKKNSPGARNIKGT